MIVEAASARCDRPKLRTALGMLKPGDKLVLYRLLVEACDRRCWARLE
ncbi:hypothetical protein ACWEV3_34115 [Saccharopolyspora sp. NPDC003752]